MTMLSAPTLRSAACFGLSMLFAAGCNKKADNTANFTSAINTYYAAHPACLWESEIKFPLQVATSDAAKTRPYDALVDQGLLTRTSIEKKKLLILSEQTNNYDLSDKGRSAWMADASQPGFGNFCYGHRKVSAIDATTPTSDQPGATTVVNYHYTFSDAPGWATAAETQTAFPTLKADVSGPQSGQVTLANTSNGWQFASAPDATHTSAPATPADGKVVQ